MSTTTHQPPAAAPKNVNRLGFTMTDYKGADSTLCAGCGHDAITSQIIKAFYEYGVEPYQVAKMSGIGCSSKTPAYFLSKSHGFNGVHGRMPCVTRIFIQARNCPRALAHAADRGPARRGGRTVEPSVG